MNDQELETRLRDRYRARAGGTETVPEELRRSVAAITRTATTRRYVLGRGRGITLLAAAALLLGGGALAAGSGLLQRPAVVPPLPAPSLAQVVTASPDATRSPNALAAPSPSATEAPSPTPLSLNLTWTKVPLDETFADGKHHTPRLAWVGDRFVLVDEASGTVRTSSDGASWQTLQPDDPDPGYAALLRQHLASWQDQVVGWWNEEDGPDTAARPPANPRHIVTVVHAPSTPVATKSFTREIESIGIGPKGIVAEVHTVRDSSGNPSNDPGSGWYSPDGKQWTQMARRRTTSSDLPGAGLPTRAFGQVVGVPDGFIASGGSPDSTCSDPDGCGSGMWFSADGLTWRFLGLDRNQGFDGRLVPWLGGALEENGAGHFDLWTSAGVTTVPVPADVDGTVHVGPLFFVIYNNRTAWVSRNGLDYGSSPIPAEMAHDNLGGTGSPPTLAVGDRNVLVLEKYDNEYDPITWSLWLGTFEP